MSDGVSGADAGVRAGNLLTRRIRLEPRNARAGARDSEIYELISATKRHIKAQISFEPLVLYGGEKSK